MKLSEIYKQNKKAKPVISIEVYPPKEPDKSAKTENLLKEVQLLSDIYKPSLISVTYGAGGSGAVASNEITALLKEKNHTLMPHLTCVCSGREFVKDYLCKIKAMGVQNILALRGDEPLNKKMCYSDFKYAFDLIKFINEQSEFEMAAAGYPEGHIDALSYEDDIKNTIKKIKGGAKVIFTQLFFDTSYFYKYKESLLKKGAEVPVVAGILPVISYSGLIKMTSMSGVKIPKKVLNIFEKYKDSKEDTVKAGIEVASMMCEDLTANDTQGLHFYTLNKSHSTIEVLKNIKLNCTPCTLNV